jgi:hypothetical protein
VLFRGARKLLVKKQGAVDIRHALLAIDVQNALWLTVYFSGLPRPQPVS